LAREDLRTTRNPPVASAGLGKGSEAWIRRRWRFCRSWPPVSGVPHAKVAYVSYLPAQKKGWVLVMLTEGLCRAGRICRGADVADRRRVAPVLGEVAAEERSGLLGSTDRCAVRLRRGCEAQGGRSTKGTERFRRRPYSPAMEYGVISGRCRGLGRGRRARGVS